MPTEANLPYNPYCMICSQHLGMAFHETNEHDEAARILAAGRVTAYGGYPA